MSDSEAPVKSPKRRTVSSRVKELALSVEANQSALRDLRNSIEVIQSQAVAPSHEDEERVDVEKDRRGLGRGLFISGAISGGLSFVALILKICLNSGSSGFDGLTISVGAGFALTFLLMRQAAQQYLREPTVERMAIAKANAKAKPASTGEPVEEANNVVDLVAKVLSVVKETSQKS